MNSIYYIFDLDGTLADLSHRLHHITGGKKNWDAFFDSCSKDIPITEVVEVARALSMRNAAMIAVITGRSDRVEEETWDWLIDNGIPFNTLYMRSDGDHRDDAVVKAELLNRFVADCRVLPGEIAGVFEDRKQVVDMYRKRGLRVYQVAPGDF